MLKKSRAIKKSELSKSLLKKIMFSLAGEEAEKLVDILYGKKNVNEFLIAKKLNITINQARNVLYKLADQGLVEFVRKKDKKKGGWYIYFWTLRIKKGMSKYKETIEEQKKKLITQLEKIQQDRFYHCEECHATYTEEEAILNDYTCPECGQIVQLKDTQAEEESIKKELEKSQEIVLILNQELEVIGKKEQKNLEKELEAQRKEKEEKRRKNREDKKKLLAKQNKAKKKVKKKSKKKQKKKVKKKSKKKQKKKAPKKKKTSKKRGKTR